MKTPGIFQKIRYARRAGLKSLIPFELCMALAGGCRNCIFTAMEIAGEMQMDSLRLLLVSGDAASAQRISELVLAALPGMVLKLETKPDTALALLLVNRFDAMLFEVGTANATAL